jgi:hypothetical protein
MRMNTSSLWANRTWQRHYFFAWIALTIYGCIAFALGDYGLVPISAQALFFLAAFSVILWPIYAAFHVNCADPPGGAETASCDR